MVTCHLLPHIKIYILCALSITGLILEISNAYLEQNMRNQTQRTHTQLVHKFASRLENRKARVIEY